MAKCRKVHCEKRSVCFSYLMDDGERQADTSLAHQAESRDSGLVVGCCSFDEFSIVPVDVRFQLFRYREFMKSVSELPSRWATPFVFTICSAYMA